MRVPADGAWSVTRSSSVSSSVSCSTTLMLVTPRPWSVEIAVSRGWPSTFGTTTEPAPFETVIETIVPVGTAPPGPGPGAITVSSGSSEFSLSTLGTNPAFRSSRLRRRPRLPEHVGHRLELLRPSTRRASPGTRTRPARRPAGRCAPRAPPRRSPRRPLAPRPGAARPGADPVASATGRPRHVRHRDAEAEADRDLDGRALVRLRSRGRVLLGDRLRLVAALEARGLHVEPRVLEDPRRRPPASRRSRSAP